MTELQVCMEFMTPTYHEAGKDVTMGYSNAVTLLFGRLKGRGPLKDKCVHGALKERLDETKTQHFGIWKTITYRHIMLTISLV